MRNYSSLPNSKSEALPRDNEPREQRDSQVCKASLASLFITVLFLFQLQMHLFVLPCFCYCSSSFYFSFLALTC
jgi:hypothetical protein